MDKKAKMKAIVDKIGRDRAVELVVNAYNTELVTTWLSHLESVQRGNKVAAPRRDHLGDALTRVGEVVDLTS